MLLLAIIVSMIGLVAGYFIPPQFSVNYQGEIKTGNASPEWIQGVGSALYLDFDHHFTHLNYLYILLLFKDSWKKWWGIRSKGKIGWNRVEDERTRTSQMIL